MSISSEFLLYLYLGKSCFYLGRKELFIGFALVGSGWVFGSLYSELHENASSISEISPIITNKNMTSVLISSLGIYLGSSIFIALLFSTILAERKSRSKAEELLLQIEELAKDLERNRIARDIHDSLGHTLTNLDIQLQLAQKLRYSAPDNAFKAVDLARALSNQSIEDVSHALGTIRKTDFDLNQAIDQLINQFRHHTSINVRVNMMLPELPPSHRHQVYLILKECFINIQKHSQASQIHLKIYKKSSIFLFEIEDDGIGFIPSQAHTGFGLKGISERIQMLRGDFQINSIVGRGTLIKIQIPL